MMDFPYFLYFLPKINGKLKNIQLKVYQWYIKKGSLSIGIKGKKSLVRVQKRGEVPVRLHFFS